jgi:uncharacterized protein (TIGR04255 family)
MSRPDHLPDYAEPPLSEVVLGIQFRQAKGYHQLLAGDVWKLFKDQFPVVEEQQRLAPSFETFGPIVAPSHRIEFMQGAEHDRFWFLSEKGDELVQFQSDRLIHNWRRLNGSGADYPRYEKMADALRDQALALQEFFNSLEPQTLDINQCEATYINHFPLSEEPDFTGIQDYLSVFCVPDNPPTDVGIRYRRVIESEEGKPMGRLYCESASALTTSGKPIITLNISARGSPREPTLDSALEFLSHGRELIVNEFTHITTEKAHKLWERRN